MKVLVTGAAGFIGRQVAAILRDRGHDLVVLSRDPQTASARLAVPCAIFPWRPAHAAPPAEAFRGVRAVIHLAGAGVAERRWTAARKEEIRRSRVQSTRHLVDALAALEAKPEVLVCASAIGYYGGDSGAVMREDAPPGTGFLAGVCREWEREAVRAESLGIRVVVLRLAFVIGRNGAAMNRILPVFRLGLGGPLGGGGQPMSWIHVRDAAGIVLHALETPSMQGAYNAAGPNTVSNAEFTRALAQTLNRPAFLPVPALALKLALGEMSQLLLSNPRVSSDKILQAGYEFHYPDIKSALREICGPSH
ncbi:MAG: TIGR01777 family oxidoreductase [Nitrospinales bacterium]